MRWRRCNHTKLARNRLAIINFAHWIWEAHAAVPEVLVPREQLRILVLLNVIPGSTASLLVDDNIACRCSAERFMIISKRAVARSDSASLEGSETEGPYALSLQTRRMIS